MPELSEEMYCSEQICIPPTFPYLLRQYAKAAIRTQPADLLRWSSAYFRCLSLNLPPPVKPRLEYPIPRDHFGVTPGWLKALLMQLPNTETISFKVLWDRWIGACLQHNTLIQILCLAGFTTPFAIPWLRFIAICAAHLTDSLTQTMILICEILTEEPEGGSAMITLEVFSDLYQFLAAIDASEDQVLKNIYFTDSLLSLYKESTEKVDDKSVDETQSIVEEESVAEEASTVRFEQEEEDLDMATVSCPDIAADDFKPGDLENMDNLEGYASVDTISDDDALIAKFRQEEQTGEGDEDSKAEEEEPKAEEEEEANKVEDEEDKQEDSETEEAEGKAEDSSTSLEKQDGDAEKQDATEIYKAEGEEEVKSVGETNEDQEKTSVLDEKEPEQKTEKEMEEEDLKVALEKMNAYQEVEGEQGDYEIEQFRLDMKTPPLVSPSASEEEKLKHYVVSSDTSLPSTQKGSKVDDDKKEEKVYEDVFVPAVPGIGRIVPTYLVEAVLEYMKKTSVQQHGMVMPRNIRHYTCPPLEVVK